MTFNDLMKFLFNDLKIEPYKAKNDGSIEIVFDDLVVDFIPYEKNHVIISSYLCSISENNKSNMDLIKKLLNLNYKKSLKTTEGVLCKELDSSKIILYSKFDIQNIIPADFNKKVKNFVNNLESWKKFIDKMNSENRGKQTFQPQQTFNFI
ncbi:MAG: type III secretion system chaperone [Desulfobacterales bacterium]|nr:type III secretion system chaperone [Desulfobacterales bacterium]